MPFISCEVCDYQGRGNTPGQCLDDVLKHEAKEHPKYHGHTLEEAFFDREMDMLEEEAKLNNCKVEDVVLDKQEEKHTRADDRWGWEI